jgi:(p)ppGpp synthase/HD superfamily hydrolase
MGYEAKKTEHSGAKHGNGAYWGYKCEAKQESNRIRRENWKREIRAECAAAGNVPRETADHSDAAPSGAAENRGGFTRG